MGAPRERRLTHLLCSCPSHTGMTISRTLCLLVAGYALLSAPCAVGAQTSRRPTERLFHDIEVWYDQQRRHSSIGYVSPAEYEQRLHAA